MRPAEGGFCSMAVAATTSRPAARMTAAVLRGHGLLRRFGPAALLAVLTSLLPILGGAALYGRLGAVAAWLRSATSAASLMCAAVFAVACGVAIVPTYVVSLVSGWAFGFTVGLGATLLSFLGAALIGYGVTAAADRGRAMTVVREMRGRWIAVHRTLATGSATQIAAVVAMVRLMPLTPFSLTNTAMAALRVPLLPYAVGTLLGMAPRAVVVTFAASRLATADASTGPAPWMFAAAAAVMVATIWAFAWVGRQGLARLAAEPEGTG
jgi:uncharacterized membrane protein YdjX (TVP38/TMEM64 family)